MKKENLFDIIGEVDEKKIESAGMAITAKKKSRPKWLKQGVLAACLCIVVAAVFGIGILQGGWFEKNLLPILNPKSQEGQDVETANNITQAQTRNPTTNPTTNPTAGETSKSQKEENPPDEGSFGSDGEIVGGWFIPAIPGDGNFELTGEVITDKEAREYFDENKNSIIAGLSASGVSSDSIKISEKGYCHIYYHGEEGKSFEIRQNSRDYLVYNGDNLVAIINLNKENGEIFNTPSFSAQWFDDYNAYLQKHKGEKLVYAYAGWFEIIIAPDNTYYNPIGLDASLYLQGVENPYEMFYHEAAVYTP